MTVTGDAGETNMLGLAFGREAQPGKITVQDLSEVNVDDFDQSLIPIIPNTKGQKRGILHKVYRSVSGKGSLNLRVAPVKPELRVVSRQELTLGSERTLLSAHMQASITRAGIFKLSFPLPKGMEVESLSGGALSHWSEAESGGIRTVTMHLNGKTLGAQQFAIVLTGPPAQGTGEWAVPRLSLNEAVRQSGELLVMPEKGIRIRAVSRKNVSRMNTQANFRSQPGARQPDLRVKQSGGLAFRLLQADWSLTLGIEKLDPWITASLLHEVTLREGQTRTRLSGKIHQCPPARPQRGRSPHRPRQRNRRKGNRPRQRRPLAAQVPPGHPRQHRRPDRIPARRRPWQRRHRDHHPCHFPQGQTPRLLHGC